MIHRDVMPSSDWAIHAQEATHIIDEAMVEIADNYPEYDFWK